MRADLVLMNGPVFTACAARPTVRALAVRQGRIVALGGESDVTELIGPDTEVVDLAGRLVAPGFQDAHVHPIHGGLRALRCDLTEIVDGDEALRVIAGHAAAHPDAEWVYGAGWRFDWFEGGTPSAALLDSLVPDRPAYFAVTDGHSGWANTRALVAAGVVAATPDPPDGRIERLADGSPQGSLHEGAMRLVERVLPGDTDGDVDRALELGARYLVEAGITAWQDAWVTDVEHAAYLRAATAGTLAATVRGSLWWDRSQGLDQLDRILTQAGETAGTYRSSAVKLMLDGVCENFTASLGEPYLDRSGAPTANRGVDFIDPDELKRIVIRLDATGLQCHFHAIGDAAVHSALDAVEAARVENGWTDLRHHVAHIQLIDPVDLPRFRRLGVVANAQPLWACNEHAVVELTAPFIGAERVGWMYPFGDLSRSGAVLAMGSDWPVSTADVLRQISVATRRRPPGDDETPVLAPGQRLSVGEALTAFTAGAAFVNHLDDERGSVEVGKVADLVVLSGDPFEAGDPADLGVDLTILAGEPVYRRG